MSWNNVIYCRSAKNAYHTPRFVLRSCAALTHQPQCPTSLRRHHYAAKLGYPPYDQIELNVLGTMLSIPILRKCLQQLF